MYGDYVQLISRDSADNNAIATGITWYGRSRIAALCLAHSWMGHPNGQKPRDYLPTAAG